MKIGHSKVSVVIRKAILGLFLCVLFLFFSLFFPFSLFAATWGDVSNFYQSSVIDYPDSDVWVEDVTNAGGGYRIWRRPKTSIWKEVNSFQKTCATVYYFVSAVNTLSSDGTFWIVTETRNVCTCYQPVSSTVSCGGIESTPVASGTSTQYCSLKTRTYPQESPPPLSEMGDAEAPPETVNDYDCKSFDVLLSDTAVTDDPDCAGVTGIMELSLSGTTTSVSYNVSPDSGCSCIPGGTVFREFMTTNNRCGFDKITGDPTLAGTDNTQSTAGTYNDIVSTTETVIGNQTVVVYNMSGDTTKTVTSLATTNLDGSTTTALVTELSVSGNELGITGSSSLTDWTGGVTSSTTLVGGVTTSTLTGGGNTVSTTTYQSGLVVGSTTSSGVTTSSVGTVKGDGDGTTVWEDPPSNYIVPSVPDVNTSSYSPLSDSDTGGGGSAIPEEKDVPGLISSFISQSPLIAAVQGTAVTTADEQCSFSFTIYDKPTVIDFCAQEAMFIPFGLGFVLICTFRSFFIIFGVEG
ncbi:MAG: hypothetical protein A3I04_01290 [Nitrospinae bacterium RIFCSPLOWO2_02_FULL_39_110]|nr:MAG: hypothetical protein A3D20_03560 [Nitrospinae bacterium RIFCSPHIGHO2_02_FULL_39_82]OGW03999.1 MAG: hypothetical protein A3I04_01290 [Nitrospinae bacterium RIFCSPLOWO2_02_FULL_39_110]